jgi:hypothetical protein
LKLRFKVSVEVVRKEAPSLMEAKIEGAPIGVGRITATALTRLFPVGDGTKI